MEQMTLFDLMPKTDVPCGYNEEVMYGRELKFHELKSMIGKKIVIRSKYGNGRYSKKVVKIMDYWVDCDLVYKRVRELPPNNIGYGEYVNEYIHDVCGVKECMACYEPYMRYDRIGYTDSDRSKKSNCWLSDAYCSGVLADANTVVFHELMV